MKCGKYVSCEPEGFAAAPRGGHSPARAVGTLADRPLARRAGLRGQICPVRVLNPTKCWELNVLRNKVARGGCSMPGGGAGGGS